ncbi:MAG TPA: M48 family metalloprotease [Longimicrobium sp.]|nr:M48 family metalloprotease [Longimicrobium sp.]
MKSLFRALLPILVIAPTLAACAVSTNPVSGKRRAYGYTWEQEVRLGRQADQEIVEQFGVYDDPELEDYVRRVGEQVLAQSHLRRETALPEYRTTKFTFRILDTEVVNAFALPGGFVYVTRGLLAHLENEAQLAVVLGHEVGHVAARHTAQNALESGLVMIGLLGAGLLGEELAGIGDEVMDYGGMGLNLLLLRYSRDDGRESDRLGVEYAAMAGYAAAEGADFFTALERMQQKQGWFPAFLSTHPDPGGRETTVRQLATQWAAQGYPGARVEADSYLARLDGLVMGEDPRQGFEENGVFYHPAGAFRFPVPRGWKVTHEGREVQFATDRSGLAVRFKATSRAPTPYAAADDFIRQNELYGAQSTRTEMNGFAGARVDATTGRNDRSFQVVGYWLEQDGVVRRFVGVAESSRGDEMAHALSGMIRGFRRLTDQRILSMQPARLAVTPVRQDAPFRTLVDARRLPRGVTLDDLAILNGVQADAVVPAGTRLKLPR